MEILRGRVTGIRYQNPENDYTVFELEVKKPSDEELDTFFDSSRDYYTVVGTVPGLVEGVEITVHANSTHHPRYGLQLEVVSYSYPGATDTNMERFAEFLASGVVKGVGTILAARMVDHFGEELRYVLNNSPERLTEVKGIGDETYRRISDSWREVRGVEELAALLSKHGLEIKYASRAYRELGVAAKELILANPYVLLKVRGLNFARVDVLALDMGVPFDDARRIVAAMKMQIERLTQKSGSTYVDRVYLAGEVRNMLSLDMHAVDAQFEVASGARWIVIEDRGEGEIVFPVALHEAEVSIANRLRNLASEGVKVPEYNIEEIEDYLGFSLADSQVTGLELALNNPVCVITGGPGTGKTTLVKAIIKGLEGKDSWPNIRLMAPTGKAAKRMEQATGMEAATIHRALGFTGDRFMHNANNRLPKKSYIVDEASMVDTSLMSHLLDAIPDGSRVILVGDVDQLPSVGPGTVLSDIIESGVVPVVKLDVVQRQAEGSSIIANAHRINNGYTPKFDKTVNGQTFLCKAHGAQQIAETVSSYMSSRVRAQFGHLSEDDITVLVPMRVKEFGADALNKKLREVMNPRSPGKEELGRFRVGDRVMMTSNDYQLGVMNGDTGKVVGVNKDLNIIEVVIDERLVGFDAHQTGSLVYAWATTVHKSQGSEYPCVIIAMANEHGRMLQRRLFYTAITRAKELVIIIGDGHAVATAAQNNASLSRRTTLKRRLVNEFER